MTIVLTVITFASLLLLLYIVSHKPATPDMAAWVTEGRSAAASLRLEVSRNGDSLREQVERLTQANEARFDSMRRTLDERLREMQTIVDEKLQGTLTQRLGESFALVTERLEQVHKGLGEMQSLANGVGDLKKVLSNVKSRGG